MNIQRKIMLSLLFHLSILIVVFAISERNPVHKISPDLTNVFFLEVKPSVNTIPVRNNKYPRRQNDILTENSSIRNEISAKSHIPVNVEQTKDISESKDIRQDEKDTTPFTKFKGKTQNKYFFDSSSDHNKLSGSTAGTKDKASPFSNDLNNKEVEINNLSDVLSKIRAAVEMAKNYPAIARKNGIEGTVLTEFSITADGLPINIKVIKSSGFNVLDSAALQTITKASPFPVIKESIEIPITFVLKK